MRGERVTVARRRREGGQSRGSLAVQRLHPVVILALVPGVMFVTSAEGPYSSLCFSLGPPLHPLPSVGRASAFRPRSAQSASALCNVTA